MYWAADRWLRDVTPYPVNLKALICHNVEDGLGWFNWRLMKSNAFLAQPECRWPCHNTIKRLYYHGARPVGTYNEGKCTPQHDGRASIGLLLLDTGRMETITTWHRPANPSIVFVKVEPRLIINCTSRVFFLTKAHHSVVSVQCSDSRMCTVEPLPSVP